MWANLDTFALVLEPRPRARMTSGARGASARRPLFWRSWRCRARACEPARGGRGRPAGHRGRCIARRCPMCAARARRLSSRRPPHGIDAALDVPAASRRRVVLIAIDGGSLDLVTQARRPRAGCRTSAASWTRAPRCIWRRCTRPRPRLSGRQSPPGSCRRRTACARRVFYRLAAGERRRPCCRTSASPTAWSGSASVDGPHTAAALRARTLWSLAERTRACRRGGRLAADRSGRAGRGYVVSDRYAEGVAGPAARRRAPVDPLPPSDARGRYPALAPGAPLPDRRVVPAGARTDRRTRLRRSRAASTARTTGSRGRCRARPARRLTLVRYESLDPIGHYFLRYAMPRRFGDVTTWTANTAGSARARAPLRAHRRAIGRQMDELGPEDLLLVVSGLRHGAARLSASGCWSRPLAIPRSTAPTRPRPTGF